MATGSARGTQPSRASATEEGLSTAEGAPTPSLIDLTAELARGGTGLIVCGSAFISREGRGATT